jgi:hypothetical protein
VTLHHQGSSGTARITVIMRITSRRSITAPALAAIALAMTLPTIAHAAPADPQAKASPAVSSAPPTPHATAAPTATPTPSPQARARAAFEGIAQGTFDRSQLTPTLDAELTAARLAGYARVLGPLGAPQSFTLAGTHDVDGTTTYDYIVRYKEGAVAFTYGIDDATQRVSKMYVRTTRS